MQHCDLIIFDWDGTLMDSVGRIVSSMQSAAVDTNLDKPCEQSTKAIIGLSLPRAIETLFPGIKSSEIDKVVANYKRHYLSLDSIPTPLFSHATQLLQKLRAERKFLAVATGKGRVGLERVWQVSNAKSYFHSSRCGDEHTSKPAPDMILSLMNEFNVTAEQTVMIGDSVLDIEMAKQAGTHAIGVTHGAHDYNSLAAVNPNAIVNSLEELSSLLLTP